MDDMKIVGTLDVTELVFYAFVLFFLALIFYLRREDRREGKDGKSDRPRFHKGGERKPFDQKPRRPEKPADPNSPFAVLSALKAQFEKGGT